MLFGPVGVFFTEQRARASGEETRARVGLEDPAFVMRDRFLAGLGTALGIAPPSVQETCDTDDIKKLAQKLGSSGVVFDFRTIDWGVGAPPPTPFVAGGYGVFYMGRVRVIRLEEPKVVWQGLCFGGTSDDKRTTLAAFQDNDGALVKTELVAAAESCAKVLLHQMAKG